MSDAKPSSPAALEDGLAGPGTRREATPSSRPAYRAAKRALDVAASAVGLILLLPLFAIVATAVKLSSPGPVFYRQARLGLGGRPFHILKFRSMRPSSAGPSVTSRSDSRITPVGRFLRRYKIDELPQLWNVLAGDMSLVGPRPEVKKFADFFPVEYERILSIRPGITDYAALEYRDEESVLASSPDPEEAYVKVVLPAKIALYHRYLEEMSLTTDLKLILRTLAALVR